MNDLVDLIHLRYYYDHYGTMPLCQIVLRGAFPSMNFLWHLDLRYG